MLEVYRKNHGVTYYGGHIHQEKILLSFCWNWDGFHSNDFYDGPTPYGPGLAHSDYHLFWFVQNSFCGRILINADALRSHFVQDLPKIYKCIMTN